MKAATTKPAFGRAAGAQSVKAMLLAIGEAENKAHELTDELPPPAETAPIIEAHVAAANSSGVVGFRGGFYEALAEWLAPTVNCGTLSDAADWNPLGTAGGADAKAEAPSAAAGHTAAAAVTSPEVIAFRTKFEEGCTYRSNEAPPALIINPAATLDSLLGAAISRMTRLQQTLESWTVAGIDEGLSSATINEVIDPLEPLAEEALQLMRIVEQRVALAGRRS